MRQSFGLFRPSGAFFRLQFSAGYTINMFGFDFRHGQVFEVRILPIPTIEAECMLQSEIRRSALYE
jgi:hypothetical protein